MKIVIITSGISRIVEPLLESEHVILGIVESMPRDFHLRTRRSYFYTLVEKAYSLVKRKGGSLKGFCKDRDIHYNYICKGRDAEIEKWVRKLEPDLIVVFSMSQLLKKEIFTIPKYGTINMHPSFLPEYRGPNPDFWQYYNMEMHPGVTIHYLDEGEDTGDVIFQKREYIPLGTKSPERLDKLIGEVGVPLMLKAIDEIKEGKAQSKKQPRKAETIRARNLAGEEHLTIIEWNNWPIERIWHVLRGTELWLNAYQQPKGFLKGQRWQVGDFIKQKNKSKPGSIVRLQGKTAIATPEGFIFIAIKFSLKKALIAHLIR